MNIFKRAVVALRRNIGRTIIWFLIFFITIGIIMATFFSNALYKTMLGDVFKDGEVPVQINAKLPESSVASQTINMDESKHITVSMFEKIGKLDSVSSVDKNLSSTIKLGDLNFETDSNSMTDSLSVTYVNDITALENEEGFTLEISKNEFKDYSVVLSEEILQQNDLEVGDTINMDMNNAYSQSEPYIELQNIPLKIVGKYKFEPTQKLIDKEKENASKYDYEPDLDFSYMQTQVFMPQSVAEKIIILDSQNQTSQENIHSDYTFNLKNIDLLSEFKDEAEEITNFPLETNVDTYNLPDGTVTVNILNTVSLVAKNFFIFGIILVSIMLIIISTLLIRGRKKEIGILLSLGSTRKDVCLQLIIEQMIPMLTSLVIMYILGLIVSILLVSNIGFGNPILLSPLFLSLLCGTILVLIATIIPAVYSMRLNPRKIFL